MGVLKKRPKSDNGKVVKIVKVHFHNSSSSPCFVVVLLLQFRHAYLNNQKELRNETLHGNRYP